MKPYILSAFFILISFVSTKAQFTGGINLVNAYGTEGMFSSTQVVVDSFENTSSTGFFANAGLDSFNYTEGENGQPIVNGNAGSMAYNPMVTSAVGSSVVTALTVSPTTPVNDFFTFLDRYNLNLQSLVYEGVNPNNGQASFIGSGELVDNQNQIASSAATITISFSGAFLPNSSHDPSSIDIEVAPEPSTFLLLLTGVGGLLFVNRRRGFLILKINFTADRRPPTSSASKMIYLYPRV